MLSRLLALALLLVLASVARSQDTADGRLEEAVAVWSDDASTADAREEAAYVLLSLGPDGARALETVALEAAANVAKALAKDEPRFLKAFEKAAERVAKQQLGRKATARVEELRAVIAEHARDQALTKETIQSTCDPAREELVKLVLAAPDDVLASKPDLAEDEAAVRGARERLEDARRFVRRAREELAAAGEDTSSTQPPEASVEAWDELLAFHALLASAGKRDRKTLVANRALRAEVDPEEAAGTLFLNRWRVAFGQGVYALDPKLCRAGADHSKDMHTLGFFAHESPVEGKESPGQRAANFGTSASSENIARGAERGEDAIWQWWYSPGHHRNMLGGAARTGLGRHERHWTQLFG